MRCIHNIAMEIHSSSNAITHVQRLEDCQISLVWVLCCSACAECFVWRRRPTFSEAKRVLYTLLSVFEPSSHALQALADRSKTAVSKPAKPSSKKEDAAAPVEPEPQAPKVSKGIACMRNHVGTCLLQRAWTTLHDALMLKFCQAALTNDQSTNQLHFLSLGMRTWVTQHVTRQHDLHKQCLCKLKRTWSWLLQEPDPPLHEAAKAGNAAKVKSLLETGANPCEADSRGKVPYDVAADKAVRDAFRRSDARLCIHCMPTCVGEQKRSRGGAVKTCTAHITIECSCI